MCTLTREIVKNNGGGRIFWGFFSFFSRVSFFDKHLPPHRDERKPLIWLVAGPKAHRKKKRTVQLWQMSFFPWPTSFTSSGSIPVPGAFLVPCGLKNCRFILWIFPAALGPVFRRDFYSVCPFIDSKRSANSSKQRLKTSVVRKHLKYRANDPTLHLCTCGVVALFGVFFTCVCRQNRTVLLRVLNAQLSLFFFFWKWHNACLYSEMPHYETAHVHT